jgi:hypothetical protein
MALGRMENLLAIRRNSVSILVYPSRRIEAIQLQVINPIPVTTSIVSVNHDSSQTNIQDTLTSSPSRIFGFRPPTIRGCFKASHLVT